MTNEQNKVREFHEACGLKTVHSPAFPGIRTCRLRAALIEEELSELEDAFETGDLVAVSDALGDLLYVVYGCAEVFGIDMEPIFSEIHRSNMTKIGPQGVIKADNGKILKPVGYTPPNLKKIIAEQIWNSSTDREKT